MSSFNFFIDTLCKTDNYFDENFERNIVSNANKIFEFFQKTKVVFNNSCLFNEEYQDIFVNLIQLKTN